MTITKPNPTDSAAILAALDQQFGIKPKGIFGYSTIEVPDYEVEAQKGYTAMLTAAKSALQSNSSSSSSYKAKKSSKDEAIIERGHLVRYMHDGRAIMVIVTEKLVSEKQLQSISPALHLVMAHQTKSKNVEAVKVELEPQLKEEAVLV